MMDSRSWRWIAKRQPCWRPDPDVASTVTEVHDGASISTTPGGTAQRRVPLAQRAAELTVQIEVAAATALVQSPVASQCVGVRNPDQIAIREADATLLARGSRLGLSAPLRVARDPFALQPAELSGLFVGEARGGNQIEQVPVQVGLGADEIVGADLALSLGEDEAITRDDELADRGVDEGSSRMYPTNRERTLGGADFDSEVPSDEGLVASSRQEVWKLPSVDPQCKAVGLSVALCIAPR